MGIEKIFLSMTIAVVYSMSSWLRSMLLILPSASNPSSISDQSFEEVTPPNETGALKLAEFSNTQRRNLEGTRFRSSPQSSRILLGIFTTNSEEDFARRRLIRKTYLSTYNILSEVGLAKIDETSDRLCSLSDLIESKGNTAEECLIVYTFVMGAWDKSNTTAPTDLTQFDDSSYQYIVDRSTADDYEPDIIYLNIRENMNAGKSETWLRYASTILPSDRLGIDLIFKVDSDTVVSPRPLLSDLDSILTQQHIQRPANGVYGGLKEIGRPNEVLYMQGGFYFVSRDVASSITSNNCPRSQIIQQTRFDRGFVRSEDIDMGNFVAYCWEKYAIHKDTDTNRQLRGNVDLTKESQNDIMQDSAVKIEGNLRRVVLDERISATHGFVLKEGERFRVKWKDRLARDLAILRYEQIKNKYQGGCPSSSTDLTEETKWFDLRPNMKLAKQHFAKIC